MVPIQAGRLIRRDLKTVFERRSRGLHQGFEGVVLMTNRGNRESMKMQVARSRSHAAAGASLVRRAGMACHVVGFGIGGGGELVAQSQDQAVAGFDSQRGRLMACAIDVAISGLTLRIDKTA